MQRSSTPGTASTWTACTEYSWPGGKLSMLGLPEDRWAYLQDHWIEQCFIQAVECFVPCGLISHIFLDIHGLCCRGSRGDQGFHGLLTWQRQGRVGLTMCPVCGLEMRYIYNMVRARSGLPNTTKHGPCARLLCYDR